MSWETFKAAVDQGDDMLTLGGGEPTLHPDFERFLFYALAHAQNVYMVTNGSQTERALVLAGLAKRGVLGVALSRDPWHDDIDPRVVEAFTNENKSRGMFGTAENHDQREIRNVSYNYKGVMRVGRAARKSFTDVEETRQGCACEGDPVVDPNGDVRQCGCPKAPIVGTVFDGFEPLTGGEDNDTDGNGELDPWCCYRKIKKSRAKRLDKAAALV